jgi:hypothetical protein
VAADEVRSDGAGRRAAQVLMRAPQWLVGWLLAGSVSRPLADLPAELEAAGLTLQCQQRWLLGTLALFVAGAAETRPCASS